jgi:serine/threonine protein kinase
MLKVMWPQLESDDGPVVDDIRFLIFSGINRVYGIHVTREVADQTAGDENQQFRAHALKSLAISPSPSEKSSIFGVSDRGHHSHSSLFQNFIDLKKFFGKFVSKYHIPPALSDVIAKSQTVKSVHYVKTHLAPLGFSKIIEFLSSTQHNPTASSSFKTLALVSRSKQKTIKFDGCVPVHCGPKSLILVHPSLSGSILKLSCLSSIEHEWKIHEMVDKCPNIRKALSMYDLLFQMPGKSIPVISQIDGQRFGCIELEFRASPVLDKLAVKTELAEQIAQQLWIKGLESLQAMHKLGVAHYDVKVNNFVFDPLNSVCFSPFQFGCA